VENEMPQPSEEKGFLYHEDSGMVAVAAGTLKR
jgi:hypothetical protein